MELYQLRTFVQVAAEGNLTRAAQSLYTSQPAISAQIKALEDELNLVLFQRSARGMQLTDAGQQLLEHAQQVLASAEAVKQQARALQNQLLGEPRIGVHTDFEFARVGALFQGISDAHPQVRPRFIQGMSPQIIEDVRKGRLDGGFFFGPCDFSDLHTLHLTETRMRVVAPVSWAERISAADASGLADFPWVFTTESCPFRAVWAALQGENQKPTHSAYVDAEDAVRELVRSGAGIAVMREDDAEDAVEEGFACTWPGPVPTIALQFTVQKRRVQEPLIRALLEQVERLWAEGEQDQTREALR